MKELLIMKRKYTKKVAAQPVKQLHKIQYNITKDCISLATIDTDVPDLSMLHSIIKFNLKLIEILAGFKLEQVLNEIYKDVQSNLKERHKVVLDEQSSYGIKDIYKAEVETFKRYK